MRRLTEKARRRTLEGECPNLRQRKAAHFTIDSRNAKTVDGIRIRMTVGVEKALGRANFGGMFINRISTEGVT